MTSRPGHYARLVASLLCAAALGALLFSVQVATMVFRELPGDRLGAGRVAGHAFVGAYGITAFAALIACVVGWSVHGARRERIVASSLLAVGLVQLFWVAPAITAHGDGWPGSFASLHATGGVLHLALTALALALSWLLLGESPRRVA